MNELTIQSNKVIDLDSGWEIPGPFAMVETREHTIGEYLEQLKKLNSVGQSIQAWTGDVYLSMTKHLRIDQEKGSKALEIAEAAGFEQRTIIVYGYVCRHVPVLTRVNTGKLYPRLTFKHFRAVAKEDEEVQMGWLKKAGENDWSAAQLRKEMKGEEWQPRYFNHWSAMPIEGWQNPYPGQIPGGILQNIIYYSTNRDDFVIDVFGGGGNMARACKIMGRNCTTYDIAPKEDWIIKHNALYEFPDNNANLVFLDPPYWNQKQGEYEPDPADLSNLDDIEIFHNSLEIVTKHAWNALKIGGYMVLIIGSSQTKDYFIDHAAEMYSRLKDKWTHINSVAAAYPTTQYSGNDVENAKKNRMMLNLYTTIQFWRRDF